MVTRRFLKVLAFILFSGTLFSAHANSFGFSQSVYSANDGSVSITLTYDYTDFAMYYGGVDVVYDAEALEFVSYTRATLPPNIWFPSDGSLDAPGFYSGVGLNTKFFGGINSAGDVGTFQFNVLGETNPAATPCGMTLCILPTPFQPFVNLFGADVTDEVLANGIAAASVVVPIPAALWLMFGGLGVLFGFGRRSV